MEIVSLLFEIHEKDGKPIDKSRREVIKDISEKKNADYCGAYELMKHDKLKK